MVPAVANPVSVIAIPPTAASSPANTPRVSAVAVIPVSVVAKA